MPFHLDPSRELDADNLMTLCEAPGVECHFVLGHNYNWRSFNPHAREEAAYVLAHLVERGVSLPPMKSRDGLFRLAPPATTPSGSAVSPVPVSAAADAPAVAGASLHL